MIKCLLSLKSRIRQAHDEKYFGNDANEQMNRLEEEGSIATCERLKAQFLVISDKYF